MKLSLGADHGGIELRAALAAELPKDGHEITDHGAFSTDSVDYPDFAQAVGADVREGRADFGILICKSGIGMSIAANKQPGIRGALVHFEDEAALCRQHNNANVLVLGALHTPPAEAVRLAKIFLASDFEGGRHERRLQKANAC